MKRSVSVCKAVLFVLVASATVAWAQAPAPVPAADTAGQASAAHDSTYVIGVDDVLAVNVWKEQDLSRSVPVRSDKKISLPLVGELVAAGRTPVQLEQDIAAKLRNFMTDPEVTVIVQEANSQKINVLGQVVKPGSYAFAVARTVVDAISAAGGPRDFAKKKAITILREKPDGGQERIVFNYADFLKGKNGVKNIDLKPHDTVVVP